jgi:hypothetical protein
MSAVTRDGRASRWLQIGEQGSFAQRLFCFLLGVFWSWAGIMSELAPVNAPDGGATAALLALGSHGYGGFIDPGSQRSVSEGNRGSELAAFFRCGCVLVDYKVESNPGDSHSELTHYDSTFRSLDGGGGWLCGGKRGGAQQHSREIASWRGRWEGEDSGE